MYDQSLRAAATNPEKDQENGLPSRVRHQGEALMTMIATIASVLLPTSASRCQRS
jgi:hypothetical protein